MNAIQQLLTDHIDIWTAAETEKKSGRGRASGNAGSVYGIKKLRELILELAVRGKLVPQNANDEPASELLKRIQAERTKLIAEGKIKKDKPLSPITGDKIPFDLPKGWKWVRNGFLFNLRKGRIPKNLNDDNVGLPYLDIEALDRGVIRRYSNDDKCPKSNDSDILVVCDGSRSGLVLNGKVGIIGSTLSIIDTPDFIQPFVRLIFKQGYERLNSTMKGAAIPHLDTQNLIFEIVGLPPLAEQHRIVEKVDELMALCDQLENQHINATEAHEKLVSHLLGTLTQSQNAEDFSANWQRIAAHFDTLFTTDASIDALKQTLLQLAVMGKLVPQDENDEPASELLKRIQAEKVKLIAEGNIKKDKPLPPITDDEKPFELPNGWEWGRMADVCIQITDGTHQTPKYVASGRPFLSAQNVKPFKFMPSDHRFVSQADFDGLRKNRIPEKGDVLLTRVGAMIGEAAVIDVEFEFAFYVSLALLKLSKTNVSSELITLWLNSPLGTDMSVKNTLGRGVSAGNLNLSLIRNFSIGLPPLAEQHRIVTKVDELMALCDQVKSRITDASRLQQKLADVLVEQAVA